MITLYLASLVTVGVLGTSAGMTFVWPAYLVMGLSGVLSVIAIFRRNKSTVPRWCLLSAIGAVTYLMVRQVGSPVAYFAREDCALVLTCCIAYAVFVSMLDDIRWRRGLFWCVAGLLGINGGLAVIQLISGSELWILSGYARTFSDRIGGLFNHPDQFAGFLAFGLPMIVAAMIFGRQSRWIKLSLGGLGVLSLAGTVLAKSLPGLLGALVGLAILGGFVLLLSWSKMTTTTQQTLRTTGCIFLILLGFFVFSNRTRIGVVYQQQIMNRGGVSLVETWKSGLAQFGEAPLFGTGSRTFYFYSRKFTSPTAGPTHVEPEFVHNEYFQIMADYGLVGLLLLLAFAAVHCHHGFKFVLGYAKFARVRGAILPVSDHLALVAGSLAALGVLSFLCCFDFVLHIPALATFAAVFCAILACPDPMAAALHPEEDENSIPGGKGLFFGRSVAFGCGIALTLCGIIFSRSEWHYEMARVSFEAGISDEKQLAHLKEAREIDPQNPYAKSLGAHALVRAIQPQMTAAARQIHLEKAERLFREAAQIYPQDVNRAIAHSVVLDALGRTEEAAQNLRLAREWAPHYGTVLVAQAEHFLRQGDYNRAEKAYEMARNTTVFPMPEAVSMGLAAVEKATRDTTAKSPVELTDSPASLLKEAQVIEKEFSGDVAKALEESIQRLEARLDSEKVPDQPAEE